MNHPGPHFCLTTECQIGHEDYAVLEAERCTLDAHYDAYSDDVPAQIAAHVDAHRIPAVGATIAYGCEQLGRGLATVLALTTNHDDDVTVTAETTPDGRLVELQLDDLRDVWLTERLLALR